MPLGCSTFALAKQLVLVPSDVRSQLSISGFRTFEPLLQQGRTTFPISSWLKSEKAPDLIMLLASIRRLFQVRGLRLQWHQLPIPLGRGVGADVCRGSFDRIGC